MNVEDAGGDRFGLGEDSLDNNNMRMTWNLYYEPGVERNVP